jgi:splicing factor 45
VGPGQVDATLEEEVGMECTNKYGAVNGVVIFEVTEPNFPADLAVRIFVSFDRQEAAIKVLTVLPIHMAGLREAGIQHIHRLQNS